LTFPIRSAFSPIAARIFLMSVNRADASAFAASIGGVIDRHLGEAGDRWSPGQPPARTPSQLTAPLDQLGWPDVAKDPELIAFAGLGAVELGRRLVPPREFDRLLGAAPLAGDLVRSLGPERLALVDRNTAASVGSVEPVATAEGLEVHRVLELGVRTELDPHRQSMAVDAWIAASVGYLAGLGEGALELTATYVRQRGAFGGTLAGLGPVQQLLADGATLVRGARLLAAERPDGDALAHAGVAVSEACMACQQVTGAIGFTLEYRLHRYTQRARALATWNDALLESLLQSPAVAP